MRKSFDTEFMAKVALEAIREEKTLATMIQSRKPSNVFTRILNRLCVIKHFLDFKSYISVFRGLILNMNVVKKPSHAPGLVLFSGGEPMRFYPFDDFLFWLLVFEGIRAVCWVFVGVFSHNET